MTWHPLAPLLGRYAAVLVALLALFAVEPVLNAWRQDSWGLSLATFFILLGSLRAMWTRRGLLRAVVVLGVLFLALEAAGDGANVPGLTAWIDLCAMAFVGVTGFGILVDIFTRQETTADTVFGASAVYLLIGVFFARLFQLLAHYDPHAFALSGPLAEQVPAGALRRSSVLYYFSLITLTTVGYGDIVPVDPLARNLAAVEGVVAQLYIAAVIARMVALHTVAPRRR